MPQIIARPSPNHDTRPDSQVIDMLLLHYTGMPTAEAALSRLCDPAAKVSAHYCIDEDGTIYRLVPEAQRAWHAGVATWAGTSDINGCSIGIEIVNPGHEFGYRAFPEPQMRAVISLCQDILDRHPIPPARVLGHSDVAPLRKEDPGELFDWPRLAKAGIGLWPQRPATAEATPAIAPNIDEVQSLLRRFGYTVPSSGIADDETRAILTAFQRHFRPKLLNGQADAETIECLTALLAMVDGTSGKP